MRPFGSWLGLGVPMNTSNTTPIETRIAYKLSEAATLLGVSTTTIRRAIKRGLIKPSRAFRHVIISKEELNRFLVTTSLNAGGGRVNEP